MTMNSNFVTLGYDLDMWQGYGIIEPIMIDVSPQTNSHILVSGISGSGKSFGENMLFARLVLANPDGEYYFADYKQDDNFSYLQNCSHYYPYKRTLEALDIVYTRLQNRQAGIEKERHAVLLIWDEYIANILALQNEDKKMAAVVMNKVSEILMIGRTLNVKMLISCQRPDAVAFPSGSRLNYGIIIILGAPMRSIYEMLLPSEYISEIEGRKFEVGEGVLLLQGSELHFAKFPAVRDMEKMQRLCIRALS